MEYTGIILTGTSASGKSTIAKKLCAFNGQFQIVQAITTRQKELMILITSIFLKKSLDKGEVKMNIW